MIRARLLPPRLPPELTIAAYRTLVREGRTALAKERVSSRNRALSYARRIRTRGFSKGYQEGLAKAEQDCKEALQHIHRAYADALDVAKRDIETLTYQLAEHLVDRALLEKPAALTSWIQHSIALLKRARPLTLLFHPRYEEIMRQVAGQIPSSVTPSPSPDLGTVDFRLQGELGGVEFSFRDALRTHALEPKRTVQGDL